ncbi:hypothetical protein Goari_011429, partial [Gossypium aridum]|nr:hypothetical protein [Gossypium aridum]
MERDEISLLEEELVQLSMKSSLIVLKENPSLLCSGEEDPEMIMEGCPWFFGRQLIIFDSLVCPVEKSKTKLVVSPFWLKVGPCPPKCDKKDLMHAIRTTFGGLIKSKIKWEFYRLKVHLDAQKSLRRGILILTKNSEKIWFLFKYENLPIFCFGCGCMGHGVKECSNIPIAEREKIDDEYSYSLALKVESNLIGKESFQFGFSAKRIMKQCLYTGAATVDREEIMPNNLPKSKHREGEQIGSKKDVEVLIFELKSTDQEELSPYADVDNLNRGSHSNGMGRSP